MSLFETATREQAKLRMAIQGASGAGKAQPVDRKVLTPSGWRPIGDLRPGDNVVDPDGGIGSVEAVFLQGTKEAFGVRFNDGSYTECCNEHLWLTQTVNDRAYKKPPEVRGFQEIRDSIFWGESQGGRPRPNHYIPLVSPVDIGEIDLPLDPWLLGVIIGDGSIAAGTVSISKPGSIFRQAVEDSLPDGVHVSEYRDHGEVTFGISRDADSGPNPVTDILRSLGLMGKKSTEKSIPETYMFSSFENRVSLMQGLLDTDGYTSEHNVEYSSSSEKLAYQMRELVQSVGGTCSINSRIPHYTHIGERREGARNWRLHISLPPSVLPVRLQPKLGRYTPRSKYKPYRSISEINTVGLKECVCIAVSTKRNLYITDDYIVTHNTKSALKIAENFGNVCLIDTERGSSRLYSGDPARGGHKFKVVEVMDPRVQKALPKPGFHPDNAIFLLDMASRESDIVIIDSGSHFWNGSGGFLELVDEEVKRMQSRGGKADSFAAWKAIDPVYKRFVNALLNCPVHVIICLRAKQEYEKKDGKVIKLGMAPEFRDQFQFEMSIEAMMDADHNLVIGKTRCDAIDGRIFNKPGKEFAEIVKSWLDDGAPAAVKAAAGATTVAITSKDDAVDPAPKALAASDDQVSQFWGSKLTGATTPDDLAQISKLFNELDLDTRSRLDATLVSAWVAKIKLTKSHSELDNVSKFLRGLDVDTQKKLAGPWKEQKAKLVAEAAATPS